MISAHVISPVLWLALTCIGQRVVGQPGHWRVGVATQWATATSQFSRLPTSADKESGFKVSPVTVRMLTAERSVGRRLSLTFGLGQTYQSYTFTAYRFFGSPPVGTFVSGSVTPVDFGPRLFISTGATAHSRAYGPFVLTVGLAVVTRYNPNASFTLSKGATTTFYPNGKSPDQPVASLVEGVDYIVVNERITYQGLSVPVVSFALSPQIGFDTRLLRRLLLSASATATLGLADVLRGTGDINYNSDRTTTQFGYQGTLWGWQVGLKYSLGRADPGSKLYLTPYNQELGPILP